MRLAQDPISGLWCREDGAICMPPCPQVRRFAYEWVVGCTNPKGYPVIGHRRKLHQVHRVVARAFLSNPDNLPTVDHIDRNPKNNRVENLRWAGYKTQQENSGNVLNRGDYGVRECDDKKAYDKAYGAIHYAAHSAERKARDAAYRATQKAKGLVKRKCSDGKYHWIMQENTQIGGM